MEASELRRGVEAGALAASALGLQVDDAVVVQDSDRIALRLIPCDVLARVGPAVHQPGFEFEVEVARQLTDAGGPVAELEPRVEGRVYRRDGFAISLWTYYEPTGSQIASVDYAGALAELHAAYRRTELAAPHFTDRVAEALTEVGDRGRSPELPGPDREFLSDTLSRLGDSISRAGVGQQLLHGEPHAGNLLSTRKGPLFIDLETCCRGPVEFDLAHAPEEVGPHYPGADLDLTRQCRILSMAMVAAWRWRDEDQFPDRGYWRTEWLRQVRAGLGRY